MDRIHTAFVCFKPKNVLVLLLRAPDIILHLYVVKCIENWNFLSPCAPLHSRCVVSIHNTTWRGRHVCWRFGLLRTGYTQRIKRWIGWIDVTGEKNIASGTLQNIPMGIVFQGVMLLDKQSVFPLVHRTRSEIKTSERETWSRESWRRAVATFSPLLYFASRRIRWSKLGREGLLVVYHVCDVQELFTSCNLCMIYSPRGLNLVTSVVS